jgi:PIN domain
MLIRPIPGADRDTILRNLQHVHMQVGNIRIGGHTPLDLYNSYISWVNESVRMLRHELSSEDLEQMVLTKRSWMLQSMAGSAVGPLAILVETEIDDRLTAVGLACEALSAEIRRWSRPGVLVVPDTSFYCHGDKLEDWDVSGLLATRHDPVHLLFPMVVVDELDRLKESSNSDVRWRARYTLAVLDRVVGDGYPGRLRARDDTGIETGQIPKGEVTMEIVLDPPGHLRLPIADDEIVDGAFAIQTLAGRPVTMITYDTGQAHRARMRGLKTLKLEMPTGPEPQRSSPRGK